MHQARGGKLEKKLGERREYESQEEQTGTKSTDEQVSAGLRDVLGMTQWRKEHPKATWAEIEAAVDEQINQLRAQLIEDLLLGDGEDWSKNARAGAPHLCDVRQAAVGAWGADALHPNDRRGSRQTDALVWNLPDLWGRGFSPRVSS